MSKQVIEAVIRRFLEAPVPQVIAVTGPWGIGKTFALKRLLEDYRGTCSVRRYAYASIFGAQSVGEIRTSLLSRWTAFPMLSEMELKSATRRQRILGWIRSKRDKVRDKANLKQTYESLREVAPFGGKHLLVAAETLAGSFVTDMLVVLDDIERIGDKVSFENLLGMVAELRDQRRCKVILVFNEGGFRKPEDQALYERYAEKVVDQKLVFQLDAEDTSEIGLASDTPLRDMVAKTCIGLDIRNIRVLQRIESAMRKIFPLVQDLSPTVHSQLAVSVPVFACALYERGRGFPGLSTILRFNSFQKAAEETRRAEDGPSEFDGEWTELVEGVGFLAADNFDVEIADVMQCGYTEGSNIRRFAQELHNIADRVEKQKRFTDAWSLFRDRIDLTGDEVSTALVDAVVNAVDVISPLELDGTVRLLREIGFDSKADAVIDQYITGRAATPKIFDIDGNSRLGNVEDSRLKERFHNAYITSNASLKLADAANLVIANDEWDDGIASAFMTASAEELVALFEQYQGPNLRPLIAGVARLPVAPVDRPILSDKLMRALQQIAGRSQLNAVRIRHWGYFSQDTPHLVAD